MARTVGAPGSSNYYNPRKYRANFIYAYAACNNGEDHTVTQMLRKWLDFWLKHNATSPLFSPQWAKREEGKKENSHTCAH